MSDPSHDSVRGLSGRMVAGARRGAAAAAALLGVAVLAVAPATAQPSFDDIIRQFDDVAFGHEHGPSRGIVQKWTKEPSIAFFTSPGYDIRGYMGAIGDNVRAIEELTGLVLVPAERPEHATLRFGFYPRAEFTKMPGRQDDPEYRRWVTTSACIALAIGDSKQRGRLKGGAIAIGTDIPDSQRRHCILEELVQVMGLPNDACHYRPSLFCEEDRVFALTPADRILLRTLYDGRLLPGMPREKAMPIVREIVGELMPQLAAF